MAFSLSESLGSREAGAAFSFATNLGQTMLSRGVADIQAWSKWEADTVKAYRQASSINKRNYRQFGVDLQNWYSKSQYVEELRQYEQALVKQRQELKTDTSIAATQDLGRKLTALDARFYEQEAADIIQLDNLRIRALSDSVKKVASGQVGRSVNAIRQSFNQQWLQNASNRVMTRKFRLADKGAAAEAYSIEAKNRVSRIADYNPRPYADPIQPLAPLAAEIYAPTKPKSTGGLTVMDFASAAGAGIAEYKALSPPDIGDSRGNDQEDQGDSN